MFVIDCPYCKESRDQNEFSPAGEAFIARPQNPEELSDNEWADYVFYRTNHKGDHWEQWVHTNGCRKYFLVKRSTISHEILEVAAFGEVISENKS